MTEEELPVETVALIDEEGKELLFALHDAFEVEDVTYYLVEGVDDPELVLVLREEAGKLVSIDGDEFERIMGMLETDDE